MLVKIDYLSKRFQSKQICSQLSFGQNASLQIIESGNLLSIYESPPVHSILSHFSLHYHKLFKTDFIITLYIYVYISKVPSSLYSVSA